MSTIEYLVVAWWFNASKLLSQSEADSHRKMHHIHHILSPIFQIFYFVFILTGWFQASFWRGLVRSPQYMNLYQDWDRHFKDLLRRKALSKNSVFCQKYF